MKKILIAVLSLCLALIIPFSAMAGTLVGQNFESKTIGPYNWVIDNDGENWPAGLCSFAISTESAASGKALKLTANNKAFYNFGARPSIPGLTTTEAATDSSGKPYNKIYTNLTGMQYVEFWMDVSQLIGTTGIGLYVDIRDADGTRFDLKKGTDVIAFKTGDDGYYKQWPMSTFGNIWCSPTPEDERPFKGKIKIPIESFEYSWYSDPISDKVLDLSKFAQISIGLDLSTEVLTGKSFYFDDLKFLGSTLKAATSTATTNNSNTGTTNSSPATGDFGVVLALAGLASSGMLLTVSRKRK